jgi:hypothetical protein
MAQLVHSSPELILDQILVTARALIGAAGPAEPGKQYHHYTGFYISEAILKQVQGQITVNLLCQRLGLTNDGSLTIAWELERPNRIKAFGLPQRTYHACLSWKPD